MPSGYAPLSDPRSAPDAEDELERAFEESDDEDIEAPHSARTPLLRTEPTPATPASQPRPGQYDFNPVFEYDYPPPPGSPPRPSSRALPNNYGNSNGELPSSPVIAGPSRSWLRRAVGAIMPSRNSRNLPRGGGLENDGVFGNVQARPSVPVPQPVDGDIHLVPEDASKDAPPSYAAAAADAVPQYWETTVHAQHPNEFMVDSLPTGSIFAFLWSFILSASLQWVGFMMAYMLHTSHAGRYGSRAGLGVTMIQFGFYFRARAAELTSQRNAGAMPTATPTASASAWSDPWDSPSVNPAAPTGTEGMYTHMGNDGHQHRHFGMTREIIALHEWTGLFLMTIGWFLFIVSLLGFYRVKRWEQRIRGSAPAAAPTPEQDEHNTNLRRDFYHAFSLAALRGGAQVRIEVEEEEPFTPATSGMTYSSREDRRLRESLRAVGLV